jgi:hypothetical protein
MVAFLGSYDKRLPFLLLGLAEVTMPALTLMLLVLLCLRGRLMKERFHLLLPLISLISSICLSPLEQVVGEVPFCS